MKRKYKLLGTGIVTRSIGSVADNTPTTCDYQQWVSRARTQVPATLIIHNYSSKTDSYTNWIERRQRLKWSNGTLRSLRSFGCNDRWAVQSASSGDAHLDADQTELTHWEIRASRTGRAITDHGLGSVNHGFHGLGTDWHGLASGTDSTDWARTGTGSG